MIYRKTLVQSREETDSIGSQCWSHQYLQRCLQGWGQFNSGIGIASQFQFRFRNWNWNWNWWNWNWKPWNWNWNWKPKLNFLQLLPQHLLVNQPFPNFSFNTGGHDLSCDWLLMKRYVLRTLPPVVWSQKTHGEGTLFPLSRQRPVLRIKDSDNKYQLTTMTNKTIIPAE